MSDQGRWCAIGFELFRSYAATGVATESDDDRVHRLESVNYELRVALKECREQLERLERLLARSDQDNAPRD